MKSSGHVTTDTPPAMPTPYPSGEPGDWRTFMVGVFLIALFLSALAFSPTGVEVVSGAPSVRDMATRTVPVTEALALQERYTQTVGGDNVFAETQTAEDL